MDEWFMASDKINEKKKTFEIWLCRHLHSVAGFHTLDADIFCQIIIMIISENNCQSLPLCALEKYEIIWKKRQSTPAQVARLSEQRKHVFPPFYSLPIYLLVFVPLQICMTRHFEYVSIRKQRVSFSTRASSICDRFAPIKIISKVMHKLFIRLENFQIFCWKMFVKQPNVSFNPNTVKSL